LLARPSLAADQHAVQLWWPVAKGIRLWWPVAKGIRLWWPVAKGIRLWWPVAKGIRLWWPVAKGIQLTLHKPKVVVALAAQAPMLANAATARICVDRKKKTETMATGFV
jgi:hypothetical protein